MSKIRTVLGDINPEEFEVILPHEHTIFHLNGAKEDPASSFQWNSAIEKASQELAKAKRDFNVSAIVDAAPFDLGRDIQFNVEVSKRSGVHIIVATGLFGVWGYPYYWRLGPLGRQCSPAPHLLHQSQKSQPHLLLRSCFLTLSSP